MNEQQKKDLVNQSVARLDQIRASLLEAEKKEEEALGQLTKSAEETPERRLAVGEGLSPHASGVIQRASQHSRSTGERH